MYLAICSGVGINTEILIMMLSILKSLDADVSVRLNPEAPTVSVFVVYVFIYNYRWTDDQEPFQVIKHFEFGLYA